MTKTLYKPARPLKRGAIVTAEIEPGYTVQSIVTGFSGQNVLLDGWPEPISREIVKS